MSQPVRLFVKNLPFGVLEATVREIFTQFGRVESVTLKENPYYKTVTAIVTYPNVDGGDENYGKKCQAWAIMDTHGKNLPEGNALALEVLKYGESGKPVGENQSQFGAVPQQPHWRGGCVRGRGRGRGCGLRPRAPPPHFQAA